MANNDVWASFLQPQVQAPEQIQGRPMARNNGGIVVSTDATSILNILGLGHMKEAIQADQAAAQEQKQAVTGETKIEEFKPEDIKFYPIYVPDQGLTLYAMMMTRHPPSWSKFFQLAQGDIFHACQKIDEQSNISGRSIFPRTPDVLAAFWVTPLHMLRCVIVGQDPYPGTTRAGAPKAVGLCFASGRNSGEIPDSLIAIYKELENTVEDWKHPGHPDLTCWARQGVLLINTALTVEAGNAGSHSGFWKPFTNRLMEYINEYCKDLVFLLWGKQAQKAAADITATKHQKLIAYHPSPKNMGTSYSFLGNNHFNLTNIFLVSKGIHPIDWRIK